MARLAFGGNVRRTFCSLCPQQCGMLVEVRDGRPIRIDGDKNNPTGGGTLCIKATTSLEFHDHPQRLNHPLKRVGGRGANHWERISWEQALDEIAAKLAEVRDREGPEALATLGGTHQGPGDWSSWRFACHFGSPNFVSQGRNCGVGEIVTETALYGWDTKFQFPTPGVTRCEVVWGANFPESLPVFGGILKECQRAGAKLIVVDPRVTDLARKADLHLQLRPRTDGALLLGILRVLIEEGLYDREFVERWCLGFDQVRRSVAEWTPQRASEVTGVPADDIVKAARMYASNRPCRINTGVALVQGGQGASRSAILALEIIKAISGNLDVPGGDPLGSPYDASQFAWLQNVGFDRLLDHPRRTRESVNAAHSPVCSISGYRAFRNAMARLHPQGHTACCYMLFADPSAIYHAVLEQTPYPIRAIIVQGGNPLLTMGGGKAAYRAFTSPNLDLLVAMDHWMTPSAQLADYVLPAADFLERPDICAHWGLCNSFVVGQQAVAPQHERRNDYELWAGLGRRLLEPTEWPETLEAMLDRFVAPSGKTYRDWADGPTNYHFAAPRWRKYEEDGFATASGKIELVPSLFEKLGVNPLPTYEGPPYAAPDVENEADYPLQMIPGSRFIETTASRLHPIARLRKIHPEPIVDIHPETGARYGINDGDWVLIERPEGVIRQKARLSQNMRPDTVHPDGYWWEPAANPGEPGLSGAWVSNANAITPADPRMSSFAGDQLLRGMRCRVTKVA